MIRLALLILAIPVACVVGVTIVLTWERRQLPPPPPPPTRDRPI